MLSLSLKSSASVSINYVVFFSWKSVIDLASFILYSSLNKGLRSIISPRYPPQNPPIRVPITVPIPGKITVPRVKPIAVPPAPPIKPFIFQISCY